MEKPTLEGEMIRLRPVRASDADAMWEMVQDPQSNRLTGTTAVFTRAEIDAWCAGVSARDGRVDLAVTANGSDEYLGEIVLNDIDDVVSSASMRLVMRPAYRGRGYGTEAIQLVLGLAFDGFGLHRVGLDVLSINTRARAIYENIGFQVEGRLRDAARDGERWCDVIAMGLLEDEFRAAQLG
ncbi:MAG TPA: GNAT family protein [Cellulomonas sp.]|uniref:GNAT family N-acetyltransferase n=1 Tax=Cellulomonas sp. TaxID=40001 RepID=UPI002E32ABAB|nr:GNAT family protein [Cellulomonas sp.]HEX5332365.1 GNAT family protein [Cellulomonas sp.]